MVRHVLQRNRLALGLAAIALVGVASFFAARQFDAPDSALADDPTRRDVTSPGETPWYWPLLEAEDQKARPVGVFSGITVDTNFDRSIEGCTDENAALGQVADAYGSALDPRSPYLPIGTEQLSSEAMMCGGTVAWSRLEYLIPEDPQVSRYGGILMIYRARQNAVGLDYSADRLVETFIGSTPAIVIGPLTDDGFGRSVVVLNEPFGVTVIKASGITLAELLKIASAIESGGGAS